MQGYTPLECFAKRLRVTAEKLQELEGFGWISITEKDGRLFIARKHEYKAKFILRLQRFLKLDAQGISKVLSYRNVDRLLEQIDAAETPIEPFHEGAD